MTAHSPEGGADLTEQDAAVPAEATEVTYDVRLSDGSKATFTTNGELDDTGIAQAAHTLGTISGESSPGSAPRTWEHRNG